MRRHTSALTLPWILFLELFVTLFGMAQSVPQEGFLAVRPVARIAGWVEDQKRVTLPGNRHVLATAENEIGAVPAEQVMEQMILVLRPSKEQQDALDTLIAAQRNPSSPYYHRWLTPESYAGRFGVADGDLEQIQNWLLRHGMRIDEVSRGKRVIIFSGTTAQVESAFNTRMRKYKAAGVTHIANATDPQVPAAFAGVVDGVASLHDFYSVPMHSLQSLPEMTSGGAHYLSPADFATIYNVDTAYDGSGQTIAIVGRSNITQSDVARFRSEFSLPANPPQVILVNTDPGTANSGDFEESMLDVEWAGAVAKDATIEYVTAASTSVSDGIDLSAQYIVDNNLAPIMSMSYGQCEAYLGSANNSFLNSLWKQAAAQGISVFVSSGDSGAAGCDASNATRATAGRAVNGLCSTPYNTCVGGTQFNDNANPSLYWSSANTSASESALSYIPEEAWNESGSSGLWSTGGGVSTVYAKPSWQNVAGVPNDGMRDVPDVALNAAGHDGYLVWMNGSLASCSGTSAASPAFAGLMASVVQSTGARQGNVNPNLYALASRQFSASGPAVFHDITSDNNSVPGVTGFSAGAGYDLTTGLGSVDASMLVTHWSDASPVPARQLTVSSSSVSLLPATSSTLIVASQATGGLSTAVAFTVSELPTGVTAAFTPTSLSAPGTGSTTLKLAASSTAAAGTYSVTVLASGGGVSSAAQISVTVLPKPALTLSASQSTLTVLPSGSSALTLTSTGNSTLNSAVALKGVGLPAGLTAAFNPATISTPGSGGLTLTITAASSVAPGNYNLTITATAGSLTKTLSVPIVVEGIKLTESANPSVYGASVTFTATEYGSPAGAATFRDGSTVLGSGAFSGSTAHLTTASLSPGTHTITATFVDINSSVTVTSPSLAQSVKAVLTVTANNATKVYGIADPAFSVTYSGFVNGDTAATALKGTPAVTTSAATSSAVGSYSITASAGTLAASNYTFKFVPGTLTVTKASPTIALSTSTATSVYGGTVTFTATISSGGPAGTVTFYDGTTSIGSGNISGTTAALSTNALKSGLHNVTASLSGGNYNTATSTPVTLTINKAVLTVSGIGSATYGSAKPVLSAVYHGWVNGDSLAVLSGAPALTTVTKASSPAGSYAIEVAAGTLAAANYTFNFTAGTLSITKSVLTVTAGNATRVYEAANPAFSATYSGWLNGDTAATLSGSPTLTTTATASSAVGSYPIMATAGTLMSNNYTFKFVSGSLTITKATASLAITASASTIVGGKAVTFTATISSSGPSESITFYDGTTSIGVTSFTGSAATFTTSALKSGVHTISAELGGTNYNAVASNAVILTVD